MLLTERKDSATRRLYALGVAGEETDEVAPEASGFARNLAIVMKWRGWNQSELARRSGVSQRHISDLLKARSDCTTQIAEQLAQPFGMRGWQLMMDNVAEEVLTSTNLQILVDTYLRHPKGRKLIMSAAEMAAEATPQ